MCVSVCELMGLYQLKRWGLVAKAAVKTHTHTHTHTNEFSSDTHDVLSLPIFHHVQ